MLRLESLKQNTPRLVVEYHLDDDGTEKFGWGIVGSVRSMTLIGYITGVQGELSLRHVYAQHQTHEVGENHQSALVIAWDEETKSFDHCVDHNIPAHSLVGMLESIKLSLIGSAADRQIPLFDATGRPLNTRR